MMEKKKSIPRFDSCCFFPYPDNTLYRMHIYYSPSEEYLRPSLSIAAGERLGVDLSVLLSNPAGGRDYLVRNNGDRVPVSDAISGKYLLICCFNLPTLSDGYIRAMITAYSELKNQEKNFEMVIVAKMRSDFVAEYDEYEQEAAFNYFFSVFPCLAVPFSDFSSRDTIIKLLGLSCLVLDPDQKVLKIRADYYLYKYGAAAFPFTEEHLLSLDRKDEELKMRLDPIYKQTGNSKHGHYHDFFAPEDPLVNKPLPLEELLCCQPNTLLERCGGGGEKVTISQLSNKRCVILYLCYYGNFMETLDKFCRKHDNKYEIVVVSIAIDSDESSYSEALDLALQEKNISSSWWKLPFVDEVSRRLVRLSDVGRGINDRFITWADGGTSGDLNARPLIRSFGYDTYPCTRKQLLDERLSCVRSLTLESFLGQKRRLCSFDDLEVSDLKNRDILLYFGSSKYLSVDLLCECYAQLKKDYPDSEMIFIPTDAKPLYDVSVPCPRLSLPPAPSDPMVVNLFDIRVLFGGCAVAVGADNQIKSIFCLDRLKKVSASLFEDTVWEDLRSNVLEQLAY